MSPIDPTEFRRVMGRIPTCVTVVTANTEGGPSGIVIGSFVSVSLNPPLVAFFVGRNSRAWAAMRDSAHLCINVLAEDQAEVCDAFMREPEERFDDVAYDTDEQGAPRLDDTAASVSVGVVSVVEAGDHDYVLGRVDSLRDESGLHPLVFHGGEFRTVR